MTTQAKLKLSTLMRLAVKTRLVQHRWTVQQLRDHVVRVAGHCRTKQEAIKAMENSI